MTKIIDYFNEGVDFEALYAKDVALRYCVLLVLSKCEGHENSLLGNELFPIVRSVWIEKIADDQKPPGDRKIRETIRQLRKDGAGIMSTGGTKGGYWQEDSLKEVLAWAEEEFTARALDMLHTLKRVTDAAKRKYGGQIDSWKVLTKKSQRYQQAIDLLED